MSLSECEDLWAHQQRQSLGFHVKGNCSNWKNPVKEAVCGAFHQFATLEIDSVVDETSVAQSDIECL